MDGLRRSARSILASDQSGSMAQLLSRMVLAYHLHGGKISFAGKDPADFVDKALCKLRPHPDGNHLVMDEPMVIEAVEIELKASGNDAAFLEYSDHIFQVVTNLGFSTSAKGDAFEPLVRRCLQRSMATVLSIFHSFKMSSTRYLCGPRISHFKLIQLIRQLDLDILIEQVLLRQMSASQ